MGIHSDCPPMIRYVLLCGSVYRTSVYTLHNRVFQCVKPVDRVRYKGRWGGVGGSDLPLVQGGAARPQIKLTPQVDQPPPQKNGGGYHGQAPKSTKTTSSPPGKKRSISHTKPQRLPKIIPLLAEENNQIWETLWSQESGPEMDKIAVNSFATVYAGEQTPAKGKKTGH